MIQGSCMSCGMEIVAASSHQRLCRECERSMNEEEVFAVMDAE